MAATAPLERVHALSHQRTHSFARALKVGPTWPDHVILSVYAGVYGLEVSEADAPDIHAAETTLRHCAAARGHRGRNLHEFKVYDVRALVAFSRSDLPNTVRLACCGYLR